MADENEEAQNAEGGAGGGEENASTGGGKKKLILIIIIALVVAGAGVGGFLFLSGGDEAPAEDTSTKNTEEQLAEEDEEIEEPASDDEKKSAEGEETSEENKDDEEGEDLLEGVDFGETYTFKKFTLNLGNPLENRMVSMDIAVEYTGGEKQKAEIERRIPQLRDAIVSVTSRKSREFLLGPDGKAQLRKELLNRLNRYMTKPLATVYITDILIE